MMVCAVVRFMRKKPRHYTNVTSTGMGVSGNRGYYAKLRFRDGSTLELEGAYEVRQVSDSWLVQQAIPMGMVFD